MTPAKQSDLKIGKEIIIWINKTDKKAKETMVYRVRIDKALLKKGCYGWAEEETPEEYESYKNTIKYYVKMGYAYLE